MAAERCPRCSARRIDGTDVCARCQWRFATPSKPAAVPVPTVIEATRTSRCPSCSRYTGPAARFCPHCGLELERPFRTGTAEPARRVDVSIAPKPRSMSNRVLRLLLTIWLIAYPAVACTPVILGAVAGGTGGGLTAGAGYLVGGILLWPWLVGILVLGLMVLLTS